MKIPPESSIFPNYGQEVAQASWLKKLLYQIVPRHTFFPFWKELETAWMRFQSRNVPQRYAQSHDLWVNIGAGDRGLANWVNVDLRALPSINCVYDCRKHLPFPNQSVQGIFCEHFLEHLDYTEEAPFFLAECHRVLQPGGILRLIVPDLEKYIRAYCTEDWESLSQIRPLDAEKRDFWLPCRYQTKMELLNVVFRQGHEHKFAYDYETLALLLAKHGFTTLKRQEFGQSLLPELCLDRPERATESLYVEAVK